MNSVSKNVYIDKLDDVVNKYGSTCHSTINMEPADVKSNTYIESSKEIDNKKHKFKMVILLEYQNIKIFLQKVTLQIGLRKFFVIEKVKSIVPWTYSISDLNREESVGTFYENKLQKTTQKEFRFEKVIKRKGDK